MRTDLTIAEAAELTGLHPETLRRHARTGKLPGAYRLGGVYLIRREAFDALRSGVSVEKVGFPS
ncbi:MAG: helix-turn-helix domain-containing protein [Candidatus Hydrogenedentes bacterium]|nr:helix-turn-helix domain-containing protein [Candidatus Hydrogenedentota bacterium]